MKIMEKYITVMFPYPSGSGLHIGHWYNYSIVDSYCKIQKYLGNEVFQPFGYDAFGLPAENYAKKVGGNPKEITYNNISNFRNEMGRMNTSFQEKLITCEKEYIKKTQYLFKLLLENNLAYKAVRKQEYCNSCETTIAKEQVVNNKCERCNTEIVYKELNQWFFRITAYKDRLIKDLRKVDYPESTKKKQINWLNNLTDWCVSRQRSWGCPIPIEGESDTLDTFVDSSFYTIIYNNKKPVDIYVGGSEHACMHLIYARFITKVLYDNNIINFDEPFKQVIHQGMILGEDGNKMSKSKDNTIDPSKYDPQLLRMYLMSINHYFKGGKWQDNGYKGCERMRNRIMIWMNDTNDNAPDINIKEFINRTIQYFNDWKVNKVVSEWNIFVKNNRGMKLNQEQSKELLKFFNACF